MNNIQMKNIERQLRQLLPFGHRRYVNLLLEEAQLHNDKNHDYALGGDPLGNFKRVAAIKKLYPGFPDATPYGVAINYLLKQLDAVLWGLAQNTKHKVEGYASRLQDMSVYSKIIAMILEEAQLIKVKKTVKRPTRRRKK